MDPISEKELAAKKAVARGENLEENLLHEIQHAIQEKEGFANLGMSS